MNLSPPDTKEIAALLRLLDDDTPEVRSVVSGRFAEVGGDISEMLPGMAQDLEEPERKLLADMLQPSRRHTLREDWLTPRFGSASLEDDWELFESHLRLLSDFLHDGVSLRQPLSDALDLLADEAREDDVLTEDDLRMFLFGGDRLKGNGENYYDPRNSDLSWCIANNMSNPIGLGVIFMLVGKRMDMEIEGICFPGHFLCRIHEEGTPLVVDCFDNGRPHAQEVLIDSSNELTAEQRQSLMHTSDLGTILIRILNNLVDSFNRLGRKEDALLVTEMRDSMAKAAGKSV